MPDTKLYKRRTFDPNKHCGAPMDRSLEKLLKDRVNAQTVLDSVLEIERTRVLTGGEIKRKSRKCRVLAFLKTRIDNIEKYGPDDRPCMWPRGRETDHPGTGYCKKHCECEGRPNFHLDSKFSYSPRKRTVRLKAYMDEIAQANHDLLDMEPDIVLLRAKVKDFVAQKGDDLDPESIKSVAILMEQIRRTVDSANDKRFKASISMDLYNLVLFKMGEVVSRFVTDPETLDKITSAWDRIAVEQSSTKGGQALMQGRSE